MKSCGLFRKGERYKFAFGLKSWEYKKKGKSGKPGFTAARFLSRFT